MTAAGASRRAWPAFALWLQLVGLSTRLLVRAWQRNVLYTDESPLLYHAATLGFVHPVTGERVSLSSPLPADFTAIIDRLRA
jgi:hypothetical protein